MRKCKCGTELLTKANTCKVCAKEYMAARRVRLLAGGGMKHDVYNYAWRKKNPAAYMLHSAKSRAKSKGWDFDLEVSDIVIPEICPMLGIPLFIAEPGAGKNPNNPSLDRIDSSKGYVKGNIQIISWRANSLKSDGTLEEFKKMVENWYGS